MNPKKKKKNSSQNRDVKTAIIIQKAIRKWLIYKKYKSKEALMYPIVIDYLKHEDSSTGRTRWKFIKEIYSSQVAYLSHLRVVYEVKKKKQFYLFSYFSFFNILILNNLFYFLIYFNILIFIFFLFFNTFYFEEIYCSSPRVDPTEFF